MKDKASLTPEVGDIVMAVSDMNLANFTIPAGTIGVCCSPPGYLRRILRESCPDARAFEFKGHKPFVGLAKEVKVVRKA